MTSNQMLTRRQTLELAYDLLRSARDVLMSEACPLDSLVDDVEGTMGRILGIETVPMDAPWEQREPHYCYLRARSDELMKALRPNEEDKNPLRWGV